MTRHLTLFLAPLVLAGCAALQGPGSEPGEIPPQLIRDESGLRWSAPSSFGAVPADLRETGDAYCRDAGFKRATGYHPDARDETGKPFIDGGYFCVGERN